jgi:dipeptidase E
MKLYLSSLGLGNEPQRLINLLSDNRKAGVILNAMDDATKEIRNEKLHEELRNLQALGIITQELDLRDYFGKKEELKLMLSKLAMVWIRGGNTFILRRAMAYSKFDEIIKEKIVDKKFVYAGYSAAICVITQTLKGIELVDNPTVVPHGYKSKIIWEGLGLLPYQLLPHYHSHHPESAAIEHSVQFYLNNKVLFKVLHDGEVLIEEV